MKKLILLLGIFGALISGINAQVKLIGHYGLDHTGKDTIAVDESGNGNDLILTDSTAWGEGVIDGALNFDGHFQAYAEDDDPFQVQAFTFATYMRINPAITGANYVLSIGDNCGLWVRNSDGAIRFYIHALTVQDEDSSGSWVGVYATDVDMRDGYWHHVAVTFDTTDLVATVYVDGDTIVSDTVRNTGTGLAPKAHHSQIWYKWDGFTVGANGGSQFMHGSLDDVRFYEGKMSGEEIRNLLVKRYTFSYATDGEGDGMVTPPDGSLFYMSDTIQITAFPGPGSFFKGWTISDSTGTYEENPIVIKVAGKSIKVTATFGTTLVALYHFDEGADTIVNDASGNGNELAMTEASWGNDGVVKGCFNPADSVEAIALDDNAFRQQALTFVAYIRLNPANTNTNYIMTQGDNYGLMVKNDGVLRFYIHAMFPDSSGSWVGTNATDFNLKDGLWHYVAVTFDTTDLIATLYIDGSVAASDTVRNSGSGLTPPPHSQIWYKWDGFKIGNSADGGQHVDGSIDEVAYYSTRLSGDEVKALMADRYELSVKIEGAGHVEPAGGMYYNNDTLNLSAVPDVGGYFKEWVFEDNTTSTENPLGVLVNDDISLTAEFGTTLVAHYKLDHEGLDTVAVDASDNGLDLSLVNADASVWSDAGVVDGCLNTEGKVEAVTDDDTLFQVYAFTFASYIRINPANTSTNYIMTQGDNYGLMVKDDGVLRFYIHALHPDASGSWVGTNATDVNLKDGLWHHVAVTFDTTDLVATLYLDGDTVACDTVRNSGTGLAPPPHSIIWYKWDGFKLCNSADGGQHVDGSMDDVMFFAAKLGPDDIAKLVAPRYKLVTSVTGNGSVEPAEGEFYKNDTLMLTAVPDEGWVFEKWDSTSTVWGTDNPVTVTVAGDVEAKAVFVEGTGIRDVTNGVELSVYPNPFHNGVTIQYNLVDEAWVNISVYNTLGQRISLLVNHKEVPGEKVITWNGTDAGKAVVPAGLYFIRLQIGDQAVVKKILKR